MISGPPSLAAEVRRRLVFWMLLPSLLAVLALGLAAGWAQREAARNRQAVVAQAAAYLVSGYVARAHIDLKHALAHTEMEKGLGDEELLGMLRMTYPQFERLFVLDPEGLLLASSPPGGAGTHFPLELLRKTPHGVFKPSLSPFTGLPTVFEGEKGPDGRTLVG